MARQSHRQQPSCVVSPRLDYCCTKCSHPHAVMPMCTRVNQRVSLPAVAPPLCMPIYNFCYSSVGIDRDLEYSARRASHLKTHLRDIHMKLIASFAFPHAASRSLHDEVSSPRSVRQYWRSSTGTATCTDSPPSLSMLRRASARISSARMARKL